MSDARHLRAARRLALGAALTPGLVLGQGPAVAAPRDAANGPPGWAEFSRYTAPAMCLSAAATASELGRRSVADQVARRRAVLTGGADTLPPPEAARVARACGGKFTPATVAAADLPDLFALALLAQDDATAAAALARLDATAPTDSARTVAFRDAVVRYVTAEPARVQAAEAALARLGALGAIGRVAQAAGYGDLIQYYGGRGDFRRAGDAADRAVALVTTMSKEELAKGPPEDALILAYKAQLVRTWLAAPDSAAAKQAMLGLAKGMLPQLRDIPQVPGAMVDYQGAYGTAATPAALLERLVPALAGAHLGRVAPPLDAEAWLPAAHAPVPAPDVVSLVMGMPPYGQDLGAVDDIRRWHAAYGDRLRITLEVPLSGRVYGDGGRFLTPEQEQAQARWYYLEHLKLPVQLAFRTRLPDSAYSILPAPDGRWIGKGQLDRAYATRAANPASFGDSLRWFSQRLIGPDGRVAYTMGDGGPPLIMGWPLFEQVLRRTMGVPVVPSPAAPSVTPRGSRP